MKPPLLCNLPVTTEKGMKFCKQDSYMALVLLLDISKSKIEGMVLILSLYDSYRPHIVPNKTLTPSLWFKELLLLSHLHDSGTAIKHRLKVCTRTIYISPSLPS